MTPAVDRRDRLPEDGTAGVDRLAFTVPVKVVRDDFRKWGSYTDLPGRRRWSAHVKIGGASAMLGLEEVDLGEKGGVRRTAKVECNPSRIADPDGCTLLRVGDFHAAAAMMYEQLLTMVDPACDLAMARVKRIDLARDFREVVAPEVYPRGLLNLRRPYAKRSFMYADPAKGNAETLFVGSGAGGVRLYDQHAAYAEKGAPEGSLRFEAEFRRDWLRRRGMECIADVGPGGLSLAAWDRWEWSQLGTQVTGVANVVDAVNALVRDGVLVTPSGKPSWSKAHRLLGMMVAEGLGVAMPAGSNRSAAEYGKLKRRLGVVPSAALFAADQTARGRLDFATGREVYDSEPLALASQS